MYKKIIISAAAAAAVVGAGGTALAVTGSDTTSGTAQPSSSSSSGSSGSSSSSSVKASKAGKAKKRAGVLRRLEHGTIVTKGKGGTVTHNLIRGEITAVSATSVTVHAADGKSETFAVTKDTKVRVRADGKGAASTISKVAKGDHAMVTGTGTSTLTAKHVVDVKGK